MEFYLVVDLIRELFLLFQQIAIKKDSEVFSSLIDLAHKNLYASLNSDLVLIGQNLIDSDFTLIKQKMKQIFRLSSGRRYL